MAMGGEERRVGGDGGASGEHVGKYSDLVWREVASLSALAGWVLSYPTHFTVRL
jgi:hypothetical protein